MTDFDKSTTANKLKTLLLTTAFSTTLLAPMAAYAQDENTGADDVEEIVVTGIRASLISAAAIKRNADQMVDAISAEDIGMFSDNNIGEALSRVPGVLLERQAGEGYRISIRGLGPNFVRTTLNGRTALSGTSSEGGSARGFSLNMIPSEVITKASVSKSTQAKELEGGMAGVLDLTTNRPIDFANNRDEDLYISGSFRGTYNELNEKFQPRGSIFLNKRFNDKVGVFIAAVVEKTDRQDNLSESQRLRIYDNVDLNAGTELNGEVLAEDSNDHTFSHFSGVRAQVQEIARTREIFTAGVQFQPNDNLDINVDWTHARENETRYDVRFWQDTNEVVRSDENNLDALTVEYADADPDRSLATEGTVTSHSWTGVTGRTNLDNYVNIINRRIPRSERINVGGINFEWTKDLWTVEADLGYAAQKSVRTYGRIRAALDHTDPRLVGGVNGSFDITGDFPIVTLVANDGAGTLTPILPGDESWLRFNGANRTLTTETGDDISGRFDVTREVEHGFFDKVFAGFSYNKRQHTRLLMEKDDLGRDDLNLENADFVLVEGNLPDRPDAVHAFSAPDVDSAIFDDYFNDPDSYGGYYLDPEGTFDVTEKVTSAYFQTSFSGEGDTPFRGNIGVRFANTKQEASGFFAGDSDAERITEREYNEVLPSFNIAFDLRDDLVLRFAGNKALSRPDPADLSGYVDISIDDEEGEFTGRGGNPFLEPYRTYSLDGSLEWYPETGGSYALGLFYKKMDGWIANGSNKELIDVPDEPAPIEFDIRRPINTDGGNIKGAEFAFHQPLDVLGGIGEYFGINASVTYVDAAIDSVIPESGLPIELRGTSKWSGNVVGYFEKGKFSARAAMSYRSNYLHQENRDEERFSEFTYGSKIFDVNFGYELNDNVKVRLSANNLTDVKRSRYWQTASSRYYSDERDNGRTFSLELRFTM